ncbi:MAG: hypothetical protein Q7S00_04705, partial [bacterium]|nr:hypothetical protein [bacterium]
MHDFTWFSLISSRINHHNIHMASSALVVLIIAVTSFLAYRKLRNHEQSLVPEEKLTLVNLYEVAVEKLYGVAEGDLGNQTKD